jgi:hypothetical protein
MTAEFKAPTKVKPVDILSESSSTYEIHKLRDNLILSSMTDEVVHIHEELDCDVLAITKGKFIIHKPCRARVVYAYADSIEFQENVTADEINIKADTAAFYAKVKTTTLRADIEEEFYLDDSADLQTDVLHLQAATCNSLGSMRVNQSVIMDVDQLEVGGPTAWDGNVTLTADSLVCFEGSEFSINHTDLTDHSTLKIDTQIKIEENAKLTLQGNPQQSIYLQTQKIDQQGDLDLSAVVVQSQDMLLATSATLTAKQSELQGKHAVVDGLMKLDTVTVSVDELLQSKDAKADWQNSIVFAKSYLKLDGILEAEKTQCASENVVLRGAAHLTETIVKANTIKFQTDEVECKKSELVAKRVLMDATAEGMQHFEGLNLQAEALETRGSVAIQASHLTLVGEVGLTNLGDLQLTDTQVDCAGQLSNDKTAKLAVKFATAQAIDPKQPVKPQLSARYIANRGDMSMHQALVAAQNIAHTGKDLILSGTTCYVEQGLLIEDNATLTLKEKSLLNASQANIVAAKSKIKVDGQSQVAAKALYALDTSATQVEQAQLAINRLVLLGQTSLSGAAVQSHSTSVFGKLTALKSSLQSVTFDAHDLLEMKQTQIEAAQVTLGPQATVTSEAALIKAGQLDVQAQIELTGTTQWQADALRTHTDSSITGSALSIEAQSWQHEGSIQLDQGLKAKGVQFLNTGAITTQESTSLGFNALVNAGLLHSTHLSVNAGSYVNLGWVAAHDVKINSLSNINVGLTQAFNLQVNSLYHNNFGGYLPDMSHPGEWFTFSSMLSGGKLLATNVFPSLSTYIQFGFAVPGFAKTMKSAWDSKNKLSREYLSQFYLHDYVEHVLNVSQFVSTGAQVYTQGKTIWADLPEKWRELSWDSLPDSTVFAKIGEELPTVALKTFTPKVTTQVLFDINAGTTISANINDSAYVSLNRGSKYVFDSYSMDAELMGNSGQISSFLTSVKLKGQKFVNQGELSSERDRVNLQVEHVIMEGAEAKEHQDFTVKSKKIDIKGKQTFTGAVIDTEHLQLGVTGSPEHQASFTMGSAVRTQTAEFMQDMHLSGSAFQVDEIKDQATTIHLTDAAHLAVKGIHGVAGTGKVIVEEKSTASNNKLELKDQARFDLLSQSLMTAAAISVSDQALYQSNNSFTKAEITQTTGSGHFKLENASQLKTTQLSSAGQVTSDQSAIEAETTEATQDGDIKLVNGSHLKTINLTSAGHVTSDYSAIEAKTTETAAQGEIKLENASHLKTTQLTSAGHFSSDHSAIEAETTTTAENGLIKLVNGSQLKTTQLSSAGHFTSDQSAVEAKITETSATGDIKLENGSHLQTEQLTNSGHFASDHSAFSAEAMQSNGTSSFTATHAEVKGKVSLGADAKHAMNGSILKAHTLEDKGVMTVSGVSQLDLQHYDHQGRLDQAADADPKQTHLIINAKTGQLAGSGNLSNATIAIDDFRDGAALAMGHGHYQQYGITQSLSVKTDHDIQLHGPYQRQGDLSVAGRSIVSDAHFAGDFSLQLTATAGGLNVSNVDVGQFKGKAKGNIDTHGRVNAKEELILHAEEGGITNHNGTISAAKAKLKGASINNSRGAIIGRDEALLQATQGDITNQAGLIQGGNYTQLVAEGSVINSADETLVRSAHDHVKHYTSGVIAGGAGAGHDGAGVKIVAKGKFINDASSVQAQGDTVIAADAGIEFKARTHTYISKEEKKKGFLGFSGHTIMETSTQVQQAQIMSGGKNVLLSAHGGLDSAGGQFVSQHGTHADVQGDINLLSVRTQDRSVKESYSLWGLSKDKTDQLKQSARPTLVADRGNTVFRAQGNLTSRGTVILGDGDLTLQGNNVTLAQDILDHATHQETQSIGVSVLGMNAFQTAQQGGNVWDSIASEDSTLSSINNLMHAQGTAGVMAASANLGLEAFNSMGQFAAGFNQDSLLGTAMQRYGLGDASGFKPSASLSISQTTTDSKTQTLGQGGIDRRNVNLIAKDTLNIIDGYVVNASGDARLEAKEINITAAALETTMESHTEKVSVGLTATGDVTNVGLGLSESRSRTLQHAHAGVNAQGNVHMQADKMKIRGGNIEANSISGHVKQLELESVQDEASSSFRSIDVNTSGMVSIQAQDHESREVRKQTGIHVKSAVNSADKSFTVGTLQLKGAAITSDTGVNDFAETVTDEAIHDFSNTKGIGLSANPVMIGHEHAQQGLSSVSVSVLHENRESLLSASGRETLADTRTQFKLNIPVVDMGRIEETFNQISQAADTIFARKELPAATDITQPVLTAAEVKSDAAEVVEEITPVQAVHPPKITHNKKTVHAEKPASEESKESTEQKEQAVEPAVTDAKASATPQGKSYDDLLVQAAACGMVIVDLAAIGEELAISSTGAGAVVGAAMATNTFEDLMVNTKACATGKAVADTYLAQAFKNTMPEIEREVRFMKDVYDNMFAFSALGHQVSEAVKHVPLLVDKTRSSLHKLGFFNGKEHKHSTVHPNNPGTALMVLPNNRVFDGEYADYITLPQSSYKRVISEGVPGLIWDVQPIKPENTLMVLPNRGVYAGEFADYLTPLRPSYERDLFERMPDLPWSVHRNKPENALMIVPQPKFEQKPWTIHHNQPENAVALTPEFKVLSNATFLQEADYANPGMLADNLASTFAGHRYKTYLLNESAELPRAGTFPRVHGQFYSFVPPVSELQTRMEKAVLPMWPTGDRSPLDTVHVSQFPRGTIIHVGEIANQGPGFWGHTPQIVIEKPWELPGVKHKLSYPLKQEPVYNRFRPR